jgi:hypothetical protein
VKFTKGFEKTAKGISGQTLDRAGLAALSVVPAVHTYRSIKEKKPGEAALGATELGGLGLLYKAVGKAHA